ncbi:hypothetical protein ColLi_09217 [Colletotrichum liriopes]|uniref:Rhodopsin domain-containing protein n=1 Tax=Colletotrichum liriopes TaxID=708192 RepID=A0AA37LVK0_9PEZI|nr:hypothetical protein ColLi_09217 [Colletotrichum liriopes]
MEPLVPRNEEGERMSDIARELPQVPVGDFSRAIQVIAYVMSSLSTLVIALRVYVRLKLSESRKVWGWDDTFAVAGWIPLWPSVAFLIIATHWGLGAHDGQIPERGLIYYQIKVKEDMFYFEVIYFASSVLTKLAMAIMIVRLSSTRVYAYIIWGNMAVLGINTTVCMIIMLYCSGYCRIPNGWMLVSYAGSDILAMVDWTCAITPFFMIRSLQMPKRRKVSLQAVLSLGVIGSQRSGNVNSTTEPQRCRGVCFVSAGSDDDDGINTGGFVMPSNNLMVLGSGGQSLPSAIVASTPGGREDSSPRRRQTRGLPGLAPGRTRPGLPPWATPPRPPHVQPRGLSAHTAFQGGPICFSPAQGAVIDSSSRYVDSARRRRAAHKVLVLLAAYQVVLWIAIFGSNVLQINAERGCEACIYLAHVAREVGEHPFVLLLGMAYGQFI